MTLKILHLSDLHVNKRQEPYLRNVAEGLQRDLKNAFSKGQSPDLIIISGDIINKGSEANIEFPLAHEIFIAPLLAATGLSFDRLIVIPGNHEVEREQVSKVIETGLSHTLLTQTELGEYQKKFDAKLTEFSPVSQKFEAFLRYKESLKNNFVVKENFFSSVYQIPINGANIGIACLNTAWRSSQYGDDNKRLLVGDEIALAAMQTMKNCTIKICVMHHPIEMLAPWDAKPVFDRVVKNCQFLLNGHVHDPDASSTVLRLGCLLTSTAGSLRPSEPFAGYSAIEYNYEKREAVCHFRKWYEARSEFDQDTAKSQAGKINLPLSHDATPAFTCTLEVSRLRDEIQQEGSSTDLVSPIDGLDDVELHDVFVEPVLSDVSSFERDGKARSAFTIVELLKRKENIIFFGRPEYGKTSLLKYISEVIHRDRQFEMSLPVFISFKDLPTRDEEQMFRAIGKAIPVTVTEACIRECINNGKLILLIDDYDDKQVQQREAKARVFRAFCNKYPNCRVIVTVTEYLGDQVRLERLAMASDLRATHCFLGSLNSARIRKILTKWAAYQQFDVDAMLTQILHYFQHCQIPVTPLAVTLFLGVLFRKRKDKSIRNEAFLIENYLETILEKVNPTTNKSELDFRDKEAFLAHIARELVTRGRSQIALNDFERVKLNYYDGLDEDCPDAGVFDEFFRKGILAKEDGVVFFKRHFWLNFFIAKALEKDQALENQILARSDVLKYRRALGYKAGLVRNDALLAAWVDNYVKNIFKDARDKYLGAEMRNTDEDSFVTEISEDIASQIRVKNRPSEVDARRDEIHLSYEEDNGNQNENELLGPAEALTLQSVVIRCSTELNVVEKRAYVQSNVQSYIALMWASLDEFRQLVLTIDEKRLEEWFLKDWKGNGGSKKVRHLIEVAQRIVHKIVPLSIVMYMTEHLGSVKLTKSCKELLKSSKSSTERLFFTILLFAASPSDGAKSMKELLTADSSAAEDFLIYGFLRLFCMENEVAATVLEKVISILDNIRLKYAKQVSGDTAFLIKDTFRSDIRKQLKLKQDEK